ncbi:PepSY domain-containing protein [Pseudomonas sp. CFBP 8770]|uniref:PepSY domain-containing protein n=1 Tax=unclassified Pseudomonas TaxID=196821 RepID=UPI00177F3355|nr:PepSY domain-containing protein [Pseudomonas sp. CFBP 8773]MBD8647390.1 PepSY domain-containing protein [Pseudomonas sp. CFBP 8770]
MREGFRQAMAWLHTWAGLVFGWLLFAIFLTGTLSYFKDEISHWAQPEVPVRALDARASLAQAQTYLQANAGQSSRWFISLPDAREPALSVMWQDPKKSGRGSFTRHTLDPQTGQRIEARDSRGGDFFYRFHYQLQMGYPWGRWLSSLAAMVMLVTLVTGIITHKKIFKEFFTFRPGKGTRSWLDGHNAVGVLVLPFHLMITYSSLVIFMTMLMPASINSRYDGDAQAFFSEIYPGNQQVAAGQPAPLANLGALYDRALQQWPEGSIGRVSVQVPGDANAQVQFSRHDGDTVSRDLGAAITFAGTTGAVLERPRESSMPIVVAGTFYGLHMGLFAGPVLRWLYFFCGLASTLLIATGLVMWLGKRQLKHARSGVRPFELRLVEVLNVAGMAGLVLAVAGFMWANRLLPATYPERAGIEVDTFFVVWLLSIVHAAVRSGSKAWTEQLGLAAITLAGVPVLGLLTTDHGLPASIAAGDWVVAGVDLSALGCGLVLAWMVTKIRRRSVLAALPVARAPRAVTPSEVH